MTIVMAHRGASVAAQENTVEAFRLARVMGADWVELDVRRSADGMAIVHHDVHLADGQMISELQSDELPEHVPSLAQALEACEGMGVNIEIKNLPEDPDYDSNHLVADAVAGLISAYLGPERAMVSSFNVGAADAVRAVDPTVRTALIYGLIDPSLAIGRALAHQMSALHPYEELVDEVLVRRAHEAGLAVNVWTVNDEARMTELVEMGVDGILTDLPDLARSVIDRA